MTLTTRIFCSRQYILGIHDLFETELAMIFSFHPGLTDSVMQRMQLFFSVSVCSTFSGHRIAKIISKISIKRCYFQFKKDKPDIRDPATMYYCGQKKWNIKFLSVLKNSM
jgi:aspartyl-tRNA synthetase